MTKHFGLIGSIPETYNSITLLRLWASSLPANMCILYMADPTQLSGAGGVYVDNKMVSFHICNRD